MKPKIYYPNGYDKKGNHQSYDLVSHIKSFNFSFGKSINSYTIRIIEYCIEAVTNLLDRIVLDH